MCITLRTGERRGNPSAACDRRSAMFIVGGARQARSCLVFGQGSSGSCCDLIDGHHNEGLSHRISSDSAALGDPYSSPAVTHTYTVCSTQSDLPTSPWVLFTAHTRLTEQGQWCSRTERTCSWTLSRGHTSGVSGPQHRPLGDKCQYFRLKPSLGTEQSPQLGAQHRWLCPWRGEYEYQLTDDGVSQQILDTEISDVEVMQ